MKLESNDNFCHVRCIHQDRVKNAKKAELNKNENRRLCQLFKAMGDETRLKILMALDNEEMCVCDLAAYLVISESAVSHQLRQLRQLHMVTNRRQGPILYYRLYDEHVGRLIRMVLEHVRE